jgi:hypothetical protein
MSVNKYWLVFIRASVCRFTPHQEVSREKFKDIAGTAAALWGL